MPAIWRMGRVKRLCAILLPTGHLLDRLQASLRVRLSMLVLILMLIVGGWIVLLLLLPGLSRVVLLMLMGVLHVVGRMAMEVIMSVGSRAGLSPVGRLCSIPVGTTFASRSDLTAYAMPASARHGMGGWLSMGNHFHAARFDGIRDC